MRVPTEQRRTSASIARAPGVPTVAGRHGRRVSLPIMAAAGCLALLAVALIFTLRGGSALQTTASAGGVPATASNGGSARSARLHTALTWVNGLGDGQILPSDVTARLASQDPKMADAIIATWSVLESMPNAVTLRGALRWIDGLADGQILTSDVTTRLASQHPKMAEVVVRAWSDLKGAA